MERFIEKGTGEFLWVNFSLFAAGFSTFALLYCVQPIIPLFSREFGLSPAQARLSMSVTTQALAVAVLVAGTLSEVFGRKRVMAISIVSASLLLIASAFAPIWHSFLILRLLAGLAFSGLPATAMAYIGEEMHAGVAGLAMGLYIGGSGLGALSGRLIVSLVADWIGWRSGLLALGLISLVAGAAFWIKLPPSCHFRPHPL
jgi:MFS transporter, YNFM family, putative membrane transport protein